MKFRAKCTPENILSASGLREIRRTAILCSFGMHRCSLLDLATHQPSFPRPGKYRRRCTSLVPGHNRIDLFELRKSSLPTTFAYGTLLDNRVSRLVTPDSSTKNRKVWVSRGNLNSFSLPCFPISDRFRWKLYRKLTRVKEVSWWITSPRVFLRKVACTLYRTELFKSRFSSCIRFL